MVRLVVMAAGQATRMGRDKLALPWQDSTVLEYILNTVLDAVDHLSTPPVRLVEVWAVAREPLERYASTDLKERFYSSQGVWCQDTAPRPLAETIRIGLQELPDAVTGIAFLPADQVGLVSGTLARLLGRFLKTEPDFLVPVAGSPGSPVVFHRRYVPELMALAGEEGGKKVLAKHKDVWTVYPVEKNFFNDIDTLEQYRRLRKET